MLEKSVFCEVLKWRHNRSQSPVFGLAVLYPTGGEIWRFWYIKTRGRKIAIKNMAHPSWKNVFLSHPLVKNVQYVSTCAQEIKRERFVAWLISSGKNRGWNSRTTADTYAYENNTEGNFLFSEKCHAIVMVMERLKKNIWFTIKMI